MVINDVPRITDQIRDNLANIFNTQFEEIRNNVNYLLTFPEGEYAHEFEYHNIYQQGKNNLVRNITESPIMSVFNFNVKNTIKIYRLLGIEQHRPMVNAIRVYANSTIPMHMDLNKGGLGRELPILSIVVSGKDGMVFMSNKKDGSRLVGVPGKTEFIMYPTLIEHGAIAKSENYDLIQIQLSDMV